MSEGGARTVVIGARYRAASARPRSRCARPRARRRRPTSHRWRQTVRFGRGEREGRFFPSRRPRRRPGRGPGELQRRAQRPDGRCRPRGTGAASATIPASAAGGPPAGGSRRQARACAAPPAGGRAPPPAGAWRCASASPPGCECGSSAGGAAAWVRVRSLRRAARRGANRVSLGGACVAAAPRVGGRRRHRGEPLEDHTQALPSQALEHHTQTRKDENDHHDYRDRGAQGQAPRHLGLQELRAVARDLVPEVADVAVAAAEPRPGEQLLDVATGSGNAAIPAAQAGAEVTRRWTWPRHCWTSPVSGRPPPVSRSSGWRATPRRCPTPTRATTPSCR